MPRFRVEIRREHRWQFLANREAEDEGGAMDQVRAILPRRTDGMTLRALPCPPTRSPATRTEHQHG
jgi:hypothetical protein